MLPLRRRALHRRLCDRSLAAGRRDAGRPDGGGRRNHRLCTAGQGCHACASKCPTDALSMDFGTQRLVVAAERCVGWGMCEHVCRTVNDHMAIKITPFRLLEPASCHQITGGNASRNRKQSLHITDDFLREARSEINASWKSQNRCLTTLLTFTYHTQACRHRFDRSCRRNVVTASG